MVFRNDWYGLFMFVREDFAEPPDATRQCKYNTEDTNGRNGKKSCEHQCEAKSQHDRPRSRCRHFNLDWGLWPPLEPFYGYQRCHLFSSTTENIDNSKNHDPHSI